MKFEGSCHCGRIRFSLRSRTPYPYRRCYCTRCRKTSGGSGFAVNVMGEAETLTVEGSEHLRVYRPMGEPLESYFCGNCGSHLYILMPDCPQWIYPFASALDTPLPSPPEVFHVLLDESAEWCDVPVGPEHHHFGQNTEESMEMWHRRLGLEEAENAAE